MEKPTFPPAFWAELAANNPIGMQLEANDVRAWFDLVWLTYSTHHYTRHRKAVISWWSRVREDEIHRARERIVRMADDKEVAALEAMAQQELQQEAGITRVDHFAKLREA